jgi:hypothetical protein
MKLFSMILAFAGLFFQQPTTYMCTVMRGSFGKGATGI